MEREWYVLMIIRNLNYFERYRMKSTHSIMALVLSLGLFAGGCSEEGRGVASKANKALEIPLDKSLLQIKMHDAPIAGHDISKVFVEIKEVQILKADGQVFTVSQGSQTLDLLELVNNVTAVIGNTLLPKGSYSQIRVILGENNSVLTSEGSMPLKIPSGEQTGIKLHGEFELRGGRITSVTLDFDAEKSVHYNKGQGFMLKPTIKVTSTASLTLEQDIKLTAKLGDDVNRFLEEADVIVEGTVAGLEKVEIEFSQHFRTNLPYTYWNFEVTETIKGNPGLAASIRVVGGKIGNRTVSVTHSPIFSKNENILLFLKFYPDGNIAVLNADRGKVKL